MQKICFALILSMAAVTSSFAFTPSSGVISPDAPELTASGGPYVVSNPTATAGEAVCADSAGATCDEFALSLSFDSAYKAANPNATVRFDLSWSPTVDDLDMYISDAQTGERVGAAAGATQPEVAIIPLADLPDELTVLVVPFTVSGSTAALTISLDAGAPAGAGDEVVDLCAPSGEPSAGGAIVDPAVLFDLQTLTNTALYGAFVHFDVGTQKEQNALLNQLGLSVVADFRRYTRAVYVQGPVAALLAVINHPWVGYVEHNAPMEYLDATAPWSTQARVAWEPVKQGPYFDAEGRVLTGEGVTLGLIDSGLFGPHPDFADGLLHNYRVVDFATGIGPAYVDLGALGDTETVGGHGTHVAGTILGSGAASFGDYPDPAFAPEIPGSFAGVAPRANLVSWGNGAGILVLSAVTAYQHMLDNLDTYNPPLRAVNNSYGAAGGTPYNPASVASCLIKDIVEAGVIMVFAAGNDGGDGSADLTSPTCKDPTPGVICVASYNDLETGRLDGPLSSFSSRGKEGDPANYPDIAAPGDTITSTCLQGSATQAICTGGDTAPAELDWLPWYGTISGTSMAAPHVTGAIGLILQARPDLTPAEVEALLQRTARKVGEGYEADPQNPDATIHFAYGAGLLDVTAALDELGVSNAGLRGAVDDWVVFTADSDTFILDAAGDITDLQVSEVTQDGQAGVLYELTVADAAGFVAETAITLRIEHNVAGVATATSVLLDSTGVGIPEAGEGNNAVAQSAILNGNTVEVFVPLTQLGFPQPGSIVHNVRAFSEGALGPLDVAPSPAQTPTALALQQPMYGRSFATVLDPGLAPASDERSCTATGLTMITSPAGVTGNGGLPTGQDDLRSVSVAEPEDMPGKLVFTMKTGGLSFVPPAHRWYVYFTVEGDENEYFASMDASQGLPVFNYGTRSNIPLPVVPVGSFTTVGDLDPASNYTADGTITLVVDKASFGLETGQRLRGLAASIRQSTPSSINAAGLTVDSAGAVADYLLVGNDQCVALADMVGGSDASEEQSQTPARSLLGSRGGAMPLLWMLLMMASLGLRRRAALR